MDPLPLVWLTSIVGAGLFSSAGYLYGKRSAASSDTRTDASERPTTPQLADLPSVGAGTDDEYSQEEETRVGVVSAQIARAAAPSARHHVWQEQIEAAKTELEAAKSELEATKTELEAALAKARASEEKARDAEGAKADLERALSEASASAEKARSAETAAKEELATNASSSTAATEKLHAAEAGNAELARQLEVLRNELRDEVIARATANARADELGDRLARASEETASLRHKLNQQLKHMRDSLSPGATASQRPAAARASAPPNVVPVAPSAPPRSAADQVEAALLHAEVARLASENRDLRTRVLGSTPPKRPTSRASAPDLDLDIYRTLVERLGGASGARCAVIADEVGSLLVGSGDLAEGLAAFGAYIKDASSRTERLLPLEGVEEIDIRDRRGTVLSTRVISRAPTELSLVLLGNEGASVDAAKRVAEETLKLRQT